MVIRGLLRWALCVQSSAKDHLIDELFNAPIRSYVDPVQKTRGRDRVRNKNCSLIKKLSEESKTD